MSGTSRNRPFVGSGPSDRYEVAVPAAEYSDSTHPARGIAVPVLAWRLHRSDAPGRARRAGTALLAMLTVQISLGIATLVNIVPLPLAALHQAGAVAVFGLAVGVVHALR